MSPEAKVAANQAAAKSSTGAMTEVGKQAGPEMRRKMDIGSSVPSAVQYSWMNEGVSIAVVAEHCPPSGDEVLYLGMNEHEAKKFAKELGSALGQSLGDALSGITQRRPEAETQNQPQPKSARISWVSQWQTPLGAVVALVTLLGVFYAIVQHVVSDQLDMKLAQPRRDLAALRDKDIGGLTIKFDGLRSDVSRLQDWQAKAILTSAAIAKPEDIRNAARHIRESRNYVPDVENIQRLAGTLEGQILPAKWDAVLELANLRSYVNSTLDEASRKVNVTVGPKDHGIWTQAPHGTWTKFEGIRIILDGTDSDIGEGPGVIVGPSGRPADTYVNVIFKNCHIIYRGGRVTLVDSFFDNSTFEVTDTPMGRRLIAQLFKSPITNFSAS